MGRHALFYKCIHNLMYCALGEVTMLLFCDTGVVPKDTLSGFGRGQSTCTVLMSIWDDLTHAMKKGDVTLMILADFLKAFNTLQYKILITKLHSVGFSKSFLSWLTSYLLDRSQFVQIDDQHPSPFLFSLVYPRIDTGTHVVHSSYLRFTG